VIRLAAVGDIHIGTDSAGALAGAFENLADEADVLLLAGDLTTCGHLDEARLLASELARLPVPTVAVLGNHDYHAGHQARIRSLLEAAGVCVLEGSSVVLELNGTRLGVVGTKGFGGGFAGACGTEFGEPEMKAFIGHTKGLAGRLELELTTVEADVRIVLLHYSPVKGTLIGERLEVYPFLGSYLLAEAVDRAGAALVLHGHAHRGTEKSITPGGIHVRNVARPVIQQAYRIYERAPGSYGSTRRGWAAGVGWPRPFPHRG
jgi:Icc-related predicted phosphoesterase